MWTYKQSNGFLVNGNGTHRATGYSGHGEGKNNPAMQEVHDVGPIPRGIYDIEGEPFDSPKHGKYCLRLKPRPENEMYGRDGFLCHGDKIGAPGTASEGCIIMGPDVRKEIYWTKEPIEVVE
jgi:hypothetical protein